MTIELPDDNRVVPLFGDPDHCTYRGVTHNLREMFDHLTEQISDLEAKVKYAKDFGLIIDVAKSSDCPEGKLTAATTEGSELQRLERGVADLICSEEEVLDLKDQLAAAEKEAAGFDVRIQSLMDESERLMICAEEAFGRRFPIQGGPSIPWRMIGPHDRQCKINHCDQDLERIAERKGLSPAEALCVLDGQSWRESPWGNYMNDEAKSRAARDELERRRAAFEDETVALRDWKELQLKVEATWDPQEVAKELGLKLNDDVRRNILPGIKALREELEFLTPLKAEFEEAKNLHPPPDTKLAVCSGLHDHIKAITDVILPDGPRGEYKVMVAEIIRRWNDAQPALTHMKQIEEHVGSAEILGHIENLEVDNHSLIREWEDSTEEVERLRSWRVEVTAALQNEGGAHYEDVPKLITAMREERDRVTARLNEAREHRDQEQAEVLRLKKAAIDCDFHVLKCPVLAGEDLVLLDPVDSIIEIAPGTDFGEGIVDEKGSVSKMGPDGVVKEIPKAEDHIVRNPPLNLGPVDEKENDEEVQV